MTKCLKLPYKILIYDIETSLLLAFLFAIRDQHVSPNQLLEGMDMFGIITISYKWYGDKDLVTLSGETALEEFDEICKQADVILGKNNFRFDDKRLNTERLIKGLPAYMAFRDKSDDLESQMRRYFAFPSFSLDALSKHFGFGGKDKMEFGDWKDLAKHDLFQKFADKFVITLKSSSSDTLSNALEAFCQTLFKDTRENVVARGLKAKKKMIKYNQKDVLDTESLLTKVLPYITLKYNKATADGLIPRYKACTKCGSTDILPTEKVCIKGTKYQYYDCNKCNQYAGKVSYIWHDGKHIKYTGKMIK